MAARTNGLRAHRAAACHSSPDTASNRANIPAAKAEMAWRIWAELWGDGTLRKNFSSRLA